MKNPFEKNDHKLLIAGIVIGAAMAGAAAYLFLTKKGSALRGQFGDQLNRLLGKETEPPAASAKDPQAYLHHKSKAPKTDRDALQKHEILHEDQDGQHEEPQS